MHAAAFSPGFAGQLIEGDLATPHAVRECQTCHAPLEEQQPFAANGSWQSAHDADLQQQGVVCAACHVRGRRTHGPPRRPELLPVPDPVPHGGFEVRTEYLESRFCAACHQFFDDPGVNGKPIENTFAEWAASPQAQAGRACQDCHMPDRAHLWRGVHDPETVRNAVDVELILDNSGLAELRGSLRVTNRDVGHAFPTYVTPRVFLEIFQVDSRDRKIEGTEVEGTIGREIDFSTDPWTEVFDTRALPGETVQLLYDRPRSPKAAALVGLVRVDPDFHYRGVFEAVLQTLRDSGARGQIEEARRRISESTYVLSEIRRRLTVEAGS
jgi:hypothetical protein